MTWSIHASYPYFQVVELLQESPMLEAIKYTRRYGSNTLGEASVYRWSNFFTVCFIPLTGKFEDIATDRQFVVIW